MKRNYVKERNAVLFSLDRERIENYMIKRGYSVPKNDIVFWAGVYKSICNTKNAPKDLVSQAKTWLYAHNMSERIRIC